MNERIMNAWQIHCQDHVLSLIPTQSKSENTAGHSSVSLILKRKLCVLFCLSMIIIYSFMPPS